MLMLGILREAVYEGVVWLDVMVHDSCDVEPIQCYQEMTQTLFDFVLQEMIFLFCFGPAFAGDRTTTYSGQHA